MKQCADGLGFSTVRFFFRWTCPYCDSLETEGGTCGRCGVLMCFTCGKKHIARDDAQEVTDNVAT